MNACRYILECLSEENKDASFVRKFFCVIGLLGLIVLPGIFLLLLLSGVDEEIDDDTRA